MKKEMEKLWFTSSIYTIINII